MSSALPLVRRKELEWLPACLYFLNLPQQSPTKSQSLPWQLDNWWPRPPLATRLSWWMELSQHFLYDCAGSLVLLSASYSWLCLYVFLNAVYRMESLWIVDLTWACRGWWWWIQWPAERIRQPSLPWSPCRLSAEDKMTSCKKCGIF